ncbi:MAG: aspartate aminotransferase family protein [Planctomycetales bacterium]|nr:aspartate aminotransferase family protein [bacterium]UNM07573.1 MAG: aspartate aminotransferase family protein [Planctomycetales bacterium]
MTHPLPDDATTKQWYMEHVNSGLLSLLGFMGLDSAELEAEGWHVRTGDGREFIDCVAAYGSYNFGHRNPAVVSAVKQQLDRMPMSSKLLLNPVQARLAHRLAEITPGELKYSFISNSGTEAVEAAIKLARLRTGKPDIISAKNAYHGKTLGSLSSTHREHFQSPFRPLIANFGVVPFGDLEALDAAISETTAAVMLEPVQGEGGIRVPPAGYLTGVREITKKHGVLLILDEVQTGMGRTGRNFACEREGVVPDILVLAKSLGGGVMPIGATIGTEYVWELFQENPLVHTSTFGGNELACAAACAALDLLEQGGYAEQAEKNGAYFLEALKKLQADFPDVLAEVRGQGMMIGIDCVSKDICELMIASVIEEKVFIAFALNNPEVLRIEPPLHMPPEVIDVVITRLHKACESTRMILEQFSQSQG